MPKKILAIASVGGHWIQLLRLKQAFEDMNVVFLTTKKSFATMVPDHKFYAVTDSNRKSKRRMMMTFGEIFKVVLKELPDVIITTGAAPGLMGLVIGKSLGIRTIWVDSIANAEELSLSGKIARKFASKVYTQWPDLVEADVQFAGNVL
ncbi:oligosaccharide biosynthesis protein Alg14 [Pedobacter sp. AW31-3R]|uniref:oligosaccharide biosynthesis protein Alg14 n=1 Tax=Pedobacter sp. AW31-3R TaxID=3445781 RepID=UPI003FA179BB